MNGLLFMRAASEMRPWISLASSGPTCLSVFPLDNGDIGIGVDVDIVNIDNVNSDGVVIIVVNIDNVDSGSVVVIVDEGHV